MTSVLAIDPGTHESGWAYLWRGKVIGSGVTSNAEVLAMIRIHDADVLAVEMIASYGMPVGAEVFETCVWIGRMVESWRSPESARLVYRREVKLHLCGTARAKDPNVRQALIDLIGPQGVKARPGPTYGVKSHAWAALGVAVTVAGITPESMRKSA